MENIFILNENKSMLWQLMIEQNLFNNIPDSYQKNVQNIYEDVIKNVNKTNYDLTNKNKMVIIEMQKNIYKLKNELKKSFRAYYIK